jgi:hypothetical protein
MPNAPKPNSEVSILPPDRSLQQKVGLANLEKALSPQAVQSAQQVITSSSGQFLEESVAEIAALERTMASLGIPEKLKQTLADIYSHAFSLKSKSGLGGYDLVSILAKSLQQYCERISDPNITPANMAIIKWHIESLRRLLDMKVKGAGGPIGTAILAELSKLGLAA